MAADNRTIKELSASGLANAAPLCIQYPMVAQGKTNEFELKSSLLHHIPKFHGLSMEDPNKHLKEFEVVCSSMTPINVDGNILMIKAFPFSLLERAKDWLYELAPGTVTSWESMKRAFLEKFFPTSRVILLRKKISGIQQNQGLLPIERQMLNALVGGALVDMTPVAAKTLIANRAHNAQQYEGVGQREGPQQHSVNEVVIGSKPQENQVCTVCSIQGHPSEKCPQLIENGGWESPNAIGFQAQNQTRYDPYSNTYNPGWRNHPNMKWREPQQPAQQGGFRQIPPGFPRPYQQNQPPPAQLRTSSPMDNDQLVQLLTNVDQGMQNQANEVEDLKKQIGQMAEFMGQFNREQGKLPSATNVNPKGGFESAKAIMLRSGKEVGSESDTPKSAQKKDEKLQNEEGSTSTPTKRVNQPLPQAPIIPKKDESEKDILETFRKVQVNIPLLEAIKQVPKYAKFLKELCTTKRRMSNKEVVKVSENVPAVLQRKLPTKCKDPGSFTIPCVIGNTRFENAMLDLGASINVMPYSIYASMNLGELKKDGVIIQLADRSNAYPKDMEDLVHSTSLPILLGRPFMKTARTKIDVYKGTLTMEFDGEEYLEELNEDALEIAITKGIELKNQELGAMQTHGQIGEPNVVPFNEEVVEVVAALESLPRQYGKVPFSISSSVSTKMLPSVDQAPTLELKPLPDHLKYVFLGDDETLPIIVSSSLTTHEEEKLVRVLRKHKTAMRWTLADIRGISPTTCMHRILLEEGTEPSREAQCHLNPPVMEVVKKEIIKLLDCGVIYLISDSHWVSPIQVVPKKSGVTVVKNDENELVPT
ncbi:unnamed protein product [Malus baccata var. baccata]